MGVLIFIAQEESVKQTVGYNATLSLFSDLESTLNRVVRSYILTLNS